MKYMKQMQLFTLLACGINLAIHCSQADLKQRKLAVNAFIRQEQEKGTPLNVIASELFVQSMHFPEYKNYEASRKSYDEAYKNFSFDDHCPSCPDNTTYDQSLDKLREEKQKEDVLWRSFLDSPEKQASDQIICLLNYEVSATKEPDETCRVEKEKKIRNIRETLGLPPKSQ